ADIAHGPLELVTAVALDEKTPQSSSRNVLLDRARVNSRTRMLDDRFAQIGTENLNAHFRKTAAERFENANGERINLFASGTARHPSTQFRLSISAFVFEQGRQKTLLQCAKQLLVAEKARHVNEQIVKKCLHLFLIVA